MIVNHTRAVEIAAPETLMPHPRARHVHPEEKIIALAEMIKRQGWRKPVLVSKRSGYIIDGHARTEAALLLGEDIPVDRQEFDSEADEVAWMIAAEIE
jgi:ParB-like chromosome segregation protein Spo0J